MPLPPGLAAVRQLHEEVGPARTTISAIAERAGVQRLTVYRHFPGEAALIGACSADWAADHPAPDVTRWSGISDPAHRLRVALGELYGYFRGGSSMLDQVLRDEGQVPPLAAVLAPWREYMREVAGGLAAGWGATGEGQRKVRAAVVHAVDYHTWRSLSTAGLSDDESADLMVALVRLAATRNSSPR